MISKQRIIDALENNKASFDPALDGGQLLDAMKKIVDDIIQPPTIDQAKWLYFQKTGQSDSGKTFIYQVRTQQEPCILLGEIRWDVNFMSYAFYAEQNTIYDPQCLVDIVNFIEAIMFLKTERKPH